MKRVVESRLSLTLALLLTFSIVFIACELESGDAGGAATAADGGTPRFEVDPSWPKEMPNKWIMGSVTSVFVDASDHVWVTHQPGDIDTRGSVGRARSASRDVLRARTPRDRV